MSQQNATANEEEFSVSIVDKLNEDQLISLRNAVDKRLENLHESQLIEASEEIRMIASRLGFSSAEELINASKTTKVSVKSSAKDSVRRTATPQFYNSNNPSQTWSGRGKVPKWLAELTKDGKASVEDFRIPQDLIDKIKAEKEQNA